MLFPNVAVRFRSMLEGGNAISTDYRPRALHLSPTPGGARAGYFGAVGIAGVSLVCLQFLPESPLYMLLREDKFSKAQILDAVR